MLKTDSNSAHVAHTPLSFAEQSLNLLCERDAVAHHIISQFGDIPLSTYLQNLIPEPGPAYQQRTDLLNIVNAYVSDLLGESLARRTVRDLTEHPVIITTNHLGVDYSSESLQGSLIFSLNSITGSLATTTIPVFACGNIPLDNVAYPRGLLLYLATSDELEMIPLKIPIFPNKPRKCMVSVVPGFDQIMLRRAIKRLDKMVERRLISSPIKDILYEILQEEYGAASVISLPTYSQQCTLLNNRMWKRLFSDNSPIPEMVYLEYEKIVTALLMRDLANPDTLLWKVLFDPELRTRVLTELHGIPGCWDLKKLRQRLAKGQEAYGTVFFWGVDQQGRRIPLCLEQQSVTHPVLIGLDAHGKIFEISYIPQTLQQGLRETRIIPSLFTCFLILAFARGMTCIGGYFQGAYLPAMQRGLMAALRRTGYDNIADYVAQVQTDCYLYGMLAIMSKTRAGDYLTPTGPVEIIASGGISKNDIERMLSLSVREAHVAALFETLLDVLPSTSRPVHWKTRLAADCFRILADRIVLKYL